MKDAASNRRAAHDAGSFSAGTCLILCVSAPLPVFVMLAIVFAPGVDELKGLVIGVIGTIGLIVLSVAEAIVGLVVRRKAVICDAALRLSVVAILATHQGLRIVALVPLGWKFAQTFDPAYACRDATCRDAIVHSQTFGGFGPQCYDELIRLADRRGGRAAAIRVLRKSWPDYSADDDESYAGDVGLLSLGRGFYHDVRCDSSD